MVTRQKRLNEPHESLVLRDPDHAVARPRKDLLLQVGKRRFKRIKA